LAAANAAEAGMIGAQALNGNLPITANDRSDRRAVAPFSLTAALAGFLFSVRAILAMITARWLSVGTEPGVAAGLIAELLLLAAVTFQSMGPAYSSIRSLTRPAPVRWALVFLGFSCSSLLWSATVSRSASFMYWCGMAADVAIVVLLLRTRPASVIAHSLMRGFIASTCLLAAIAWIMPTQEDLRLGDQDYFNTNQIANLCALAIFMAQFLLSRKEGTGKTAIVFLTITLLRSLSKATIVAFVVAEGFILIYDKTLSRKKKVLIISGAILLLLAFGGLIGSYFDTYTTTGNQAATLTGRTAIWAYTLEQSLEKPWIGNGLDAMWKVFPPFGRDQFEARHAENELLQQFFAYGLAGVVILIGLYGSLFRRIRKHQGPAKAILAGIMLYVIVRGFAEAEPFDLLLPLWMITLIGCVVEPFESSREQHDPQTPARARYAVLPIPGSAPR
jgi:exopolysaccharide production protein ExoQ